MADRTSNSSTDDAGASFMRGVRRLADAIDEIYSRNREDVCWIEARDRGPGAAQDVHAMTKCLQEVSGDPQALAGFVAALTGFIAPTEHSSWEDVVSYFRELRYEQCVARSQ